MEKTKFFIIIIIIVIIGFCSRGEQVQLVENLQIPAAIGNDLNKNTGINSYEVSILTYEFEKGGNITSTIISGTAKNIGETRETRQLKSGKVYILGLERIILNSEEVARNGMRNLLDLWLNNPQVNDRSLCVICKGKPEEIFKYKVKGYATSADFIEGMIKSLRQFNFFPEQYSVIDLIVRADAEGRNAILPYIELKENGIETTGLALFKGDKMIAKADMPEARIINILKDTNLKGMLTLQRSSTENINFYATSQRKVNCYKEGEKLKFIIDLDLKGSISSNELYKNLYNDSKVLKEFEEDMQKYVEKMCNESVNKIKCAYKTDVLGLGKFAAAKYGRHTGVDWNELVCKSNIQVNVKVKVTTQGRGNY